jgi:hypothetical protein
MKEYTIKGKINSKSNRKKIPLLLYVIIPFLSFFLYILIFSQSPLQVFRNTLPTDAGVRYETFTISFDDSVPLSIREEIEESVKHLEFQGKKRFEFEDKGRYTIRLSNNGERVIATNQLVPVGHLYWVNNKVGIDDISKFNSILLEEEEYGAAKDFLNEIFNNKVEIKRVDSLLNELKDSEEGIGFVFSHNLSKEYRVLYWDGKYFLDDTDGSISISYVIEGRRDIELVHSLLERNWTKSKEQEFNDELVLKINMTGVTAMSRGLAMKIDSSGDFAYPARDIGKFLSNADLTHTSNEVSFMDGCSVYSGMRFCSKPEYIETLKASGVNIVELTGNHNNDFGADKSVKSIEMYKELGWDYFGGGLNDEDASKILYKEVKGSTVAFLGYNYYDSMFRSAALAGQNRAGANFYSVEKMERNIKEARENADVVIVTFQFQECWSYPPTDVIYPICYKPLSNPDQKGTFRKAIDFGADIVIGTQAHQPQTYELYNGGTIFYGLGNLYFDQHRWIGTRQGMVLSIYVLDGEVIQTRITPTIYDRDLIPRVASQSEADLLLDLLKKARTF